MPDHAQTPDGFTVGRTVLAGTTVLAPSGSLTFETCTELRTAFESACAEHSSTVVLDCRGVAFMDSEGLELLVEMHEKLAENRGQLRLIHLNDVCADTLTASRLVNVLVVLGDLNQAIRGP